MCLINASQYATNFVSLLSQLISQSSSINSTRSWLWGLTVYITIDSCFNFDVQQVQRVQRLWVSEVTNWSSDHRLELPFDDAWRTIWVGDVTHRCVSGRLVGVGCHLYDIVTSYDRGKAPRMCRTRWFVGSCNVGIQTVWVELTCTPQTTHAMCKVLRLD